MSDRLYSKDHEWIEMDADIGTIGVSDHAQEQLGDVVFVELPAVGATFNKDEQAAVVESVKAAAEVYAPFDGEVVEVNDALEGNPGLVNTEPEGDGWFFKLKVTDASQLEDLLSTEAYLEFVAGLG
jgi:glycine cleavage system H protein